MVKTSESRVKTETVILVACLITIVISGSSLYYISTLMSNTRKSSEDLSTLTDTVADLASTTGTLVGTIGDLAGAVGESSETMMALEERIKAIEEALTPEYPEYKRTLVIAIPEEPEGLDIQQISWSNEPHDMILQPFMAFDSEMNIVPDLAVKAIIEEDSIFIYLPEDAKFSNGDPITAEDIKDAIERYVRLSPYSYDYEALDHIDIVDEHTAKLVFKASPGYVWTQDLPTTYGTIVDTKIAEEIGDAAFNLKPIGSGLYKVKEWVLGSHVVLVRNDLYKTNLPFVENKGPNLYIDEVIIRFIPEDLTRISEFEAGKVDILRGVPVDAVERLKNNADVDLYETLTSGVEYIMVNMRKPPLDDVKVRQAIMFAVNRADIVTVLEETALMSYSFMSPSMLCYNASLEEFAEKEYAYSVEKAKSLLEEAGWVDTDNDGIVDKDGKPLELEFLVPNDDPKLKRIGPLVMSQLADIGVKVNVREFNYNYIRDRTRNWDFELAARFYSWHDPSGILPYIFHSVVGNMTYSNPDVDALFDEDLSTWMEPTERTKLYTEIQLIMLDDLPAIPLFISKDYTAVWKTVQDLHVLPPFGTMYINDARIVEK